MYELRKNGYTENTIYRVLLHLTKQHLAILYFMSQTYLHGKPLMFKSWTRAGQLTTTVSLPLF